MKLLFAKAAVYCLPFTAVLGYPLLVLYSSGELTPLADVVEIQQQDTPTLHGLAYSNQDKALKLMATQARRPEVLALGNSRVSQFRAGFFRDSVNFYNATMSATGVADFRRFLDQIPDGQQPQLILLGLDQWFFNEKFWDYDKKALPERFEAQDQADIFENFWRTVIKDRLKNKFTLSNIWGDPHLIGINAKIRHTGFRNDGSIRYGHILANPNDSTLEDYNFRSSLKDIKTGHHSWGHAQEVSGEALRELRLFLRDCAARDIHVIGFLPPYAHTVWKVMQSMSTEYAYLSKLEASLSPLFEERGFELYNFSDITSVGSSDAEALDGNHGSEKTHLRLMIKLLKQGSALSRYADLDALETCLQNSSSNLETVCSTHATTSIPHQIL